METSVHFQTQPIQSQENERSYFDGGLLSYIGHNLLAFLVTVCTLGICYPFAIVLLIRWKLKHTVIEGKRLRFEGSAMGLFGNFIKWWLLCIITIGIYSFWLVIKMEQWKAKHTYFA